MEAKLTGKGNYIHVAGEMIFPNPESDYLANIEWKMRHAHMDLTDRELLHAASVIDAYREIIYRKSLSERNKVCSAMKRVCAESK